MARVFQTVRGRFSIGGAPVKITANRDTVLKTHPLDRASKNLPKDFRYYQIPAGKVFACAKATKDIGSHIKIEFSPHLTVGSTKYTALYVFHPHWDGVNGVIDTAVAKAQAYSPAGSPWLKVPCGVNVQNNNHDWADDGSASNLRYGGVQCGGTSLANALEPHLSAQEKAKIVAGSPTGRYDDGVLAVFKKLGEQSILMESHVAVAQHLGFKAECSRDYTAADACQHMEKTGAAVVAGTNYSASGHFVCFNGFHRKTGAFQLVDPYGVRDSSGCSWDVIFQEESDFEYYEWDLDTVGSLWSGNRDGWGVFIWPKTPQIILPQPVAIAATAAPSNALTSTVTATQSTILKAQPVPSGSLPPGQKTTLVANFPIECVVHKAENNHVLITLPSSAKINGRDTWYAYRPHLKIVTPGGLTDSEPGSEVTLADYERIATLVGCEVAALRAVVAVESKGAGFIAPGKAKILFESQWFGYFTNDQYNDSHPKISSYARNPDLYLGGLPEWDRLNAAIALDKDAAIKSASWGLGQVMGMHYEALGYASVDEWVRLMNRSEADQIEAMARFIKANPGAYKGLVNRDWATLAYHYNGEAYAENQYDVKLAEAYAGFC